MRSDDWSEEVSPFWGEVIKSALTAEGIAGLLKAGWTTIKVSQTHKDFSFKRYSLLQGT